MIMNSRLMHISMYCSLLAAVLIFSACNSSEDEEQENSYDRQALLVNLADNVIIPAYSDLNASVNNLNAQAVTLQSDVTPENVQNLRDSWKQVARKWQRVALFDFGPASQNGLLSAFNLYPVSADQINSNISSGTYNLESAQNINAVGLQALDYLLYRNEQTAAQHAASLSQNPNELQYILDLTELMKTKCNAVHSAWSGDYRTTFISATGTDVGSSLGQLINGSIKYFEIHLRDAKIGIPAGARSSSGLPIPEQSEAYYNADLAHELLIEGISSWKNMFNGGNGEGLDDYLRFLGPTFNGNPLSDEINLFFDSAIQQSEALPTPLQDALVNNQEDCLAVFDELQKLVVLLKVDMTSAMGISVTYVDNDGD